MGTYGGVEVVMHKEHYVPAALSARKESINIGRILVGLRERVGVVMKRKIPDPARNRILFSIPWLVTVLAELLPFVGKR
jgi:hypothetical protein